MCVYVCVCVWGVCVWGVCVGCVCVCVCRVGVCVPHLIKFLENFSMISLNLVRLSTQTQYSYTTHINNMSDSVTLYVWPVWSCRDF